MSFKDKFKKFFGIYRFDEILAHYNQNIKLASQFNVKDSAYEYLGKYFPDHMTEIIHYLKQISANIVDLLKCQNCRGQ